MAKAEPMPPPNADGEYPFVDGRILVKREWRTVIHKQPAEKTTCITSLPDNRCACGTYEIVSVPESPDLENLADQAARLAREWGLPDQERQIYEVLKEGERLPEEERYPGSRGGGARVPPRPRKSGLPTLDKAHIEVMRLHELHRQLVDDAVEFFAKARGDALEPDQVDKFLTRIEKGSRAIKRQWPRLDRALKVLQGGAVAVLSQDPEAEGIRNKKAELVRLLRGLSYAGTWLLIAFHQLPYLAVAFALWGRVRPLHVGALAGSLVAAYRTMHEPWGPDRQAYVNLPTDEFPLSSHIEVSREMLWEAAQDLRKLVRVSQWLKVRILNEERRVTAARRLCEKAKEKVERDIAASDRDAVNDAVIDQVIDTVMDRWGSLPLKELARHIGEGTLDVVRDAIESALNRTHGTRGVPLLSLSDNAVARQADKTMAEEDRFRIKFVEEAGDLPPVNERLRRILKDPRFQKIRKAIKAGANPISPTDIARHIKKRSPTPRTIHNWERALQRLFRQ